MLVEIQMFIFDVLIYSYFFYHDCIFINFYSNAVPKFPVYGTIKFYCIVLYCILCQVVLDAVKETCSSKFENPGHKLGIFHF